MIYTTTFNILINICGLEGILLTSFFTSLWIEEVKSWTNLFTCKFTLHTDQTRHYDLYSHNDQTPSISTTTSALS